MPGSGRKVLVAEDNPAMGDVVRFNLQNAGFAVTVCRNGVDALRTLQQGKFDLVVTDYQMPGLNGEQLCGEIRSDSRLLHLPVIIVSARGLELDLNRLQEQFQITAVVFKPFSPRELVKLVHSSLEPVTAESP